MQPICTSALATFTYIRGNKQKKNDKESRNRICAIRNGTNCITSGETNPEEYVFYILYAEYQKLQNKQLEREIQSDAYSRVLSDKKLQSYSEVSRSS